MTTNKLLRWAVPLLFIMSAAFISCDSTNSVNELEESLAAVPSLNLVEGAESVVATVNRDRNRSNFRIDLNGMKENSRIQAGEYDAFCAMWDVAINSNGESYGEVSIHSIQDESYWQGINYVINELDRYYEENEDLTWLEVQIALWSIMDHKKFDLNTIPATDLPNYVRDGDFDQELIDMIVKDVKENKHTFDPSEPGLRAYYAEVPNAQDQIIIVPGPGDKEKGFGVRFRNFTSSAAQHEIYLGVGDLGVGQNRAQKHATYTPNGTTEIDFIYHAGDDKLSASAGSDYVEYTNLSSNMPFGCSIADIDRAVVWVSARDVGTTVTVSTTVDGQPVSITADGNGTDSKFYTIYNIDVTNGFSLVGDLTISGTFTDGERGKVELIFGCPPSIQL